MMMMIVMTMMLMMMMIAHQSRWESELGVDKTNDGDYLEWKTPHVVQVPHELSEQEKLF